MTVTWRLFWTAVAAAATLTAGICALTVTLTTTIAVLVAVVLGARPAALWALSGSNSVAYLPITVVRRSSTALMVATAVHAGWIVVFGLATHPQRWVLVGVLTGLATVEYAVATLVIYINTHRAKNVRTPEPAPELGNSGLVIQSSLGLSGYGYLQVKDVTPLGDSGLRCRVAVPAGRQAPTSTAVAEQVAVALSDVLGRDLQSSWVQFRKSPAAGQYVLTVVTRDVLGDVIPYVDDPTWTSITTPMVIGYGLDHAPHPLLLAAHGEDIGKTRSGKSCMIDTKIAYLSRCRDAIIWTCGTEKLYDLVAGWIEPYQDTDYPLVFDWIANGPRDTLSMLIAAMQVARWRQRQPMRTRHGWPHIVILLDEASFALKNRDATGTYQGQQVTMSRMAAMISQGAGSANVWLHRATQRSTQDHSGDHGGDVSTNVGYRAAFQSADWAEVGRMMGDYRLPTPTHQGEFWLNDGHTEPVLLKGPYLQEIDPSKAHLHDGATVSDVAWARREFVRCLDPGSAGAAGEAYALRHRRMDAALATYLTGEDPVGESEGPADPQQAGYDAVMQELHRAVGAGPDQSRGGVATMAGHRTHAERITEIISAAPEPVALAEIVSALRAGGDDVSPQVVTNALTKLVTEQRVQRLERGRYFTHTNTHTSAVGV